MEIKFTAKVKKEILADIDKGLKVDELAKKYGTSKLQMQRWIGRMRAKLDGGLPEGVVNCTKEVCKSCYYGDLQGRGCNYMDLTGKSRIVEKVLPDGEVIYHNLCSSCGCYKKGEPHGLAGVIY